MVKSVFKDLLVEVFSKVYDGVLEVATTRFIIAFSSSIMFFALFGSSDSEVSHVSFFAFLTDFEIGVSVKLGNFIGWNPTLSVESIDILGDNMFQ